MIWFPVRTSVQTSHKEKFKMVHRVQFLNLAASRRPVVHHLDRKNDEKEVGSRSLASLMDGGGGITGLSRSEIIGGDTTH